jgi:hypothetical protein
MSTQLERQLESHRIWRERLILAIESFRSQLDTSKEVNVEQSLRMYDLIESLRNDRMLLAFIAEFSRGKTELINAMFFSAYGRRLLPSDIGRTTMCPTELYHDPSETPYLRLLPIETRETDDSLSALKRKPIEWIRIPLDLADPDGLAETLAKVSESKLVPVARARQLGLWDDRDPQGSTAVLVEQGRVRIPVWRHALINFPHPMLKAGLAVLDTPGLNAIGAEPELTLALIPSAHAVLYVLGVDTGVTRSDMEVWQRHVQNHGARCVSVLNKVDLLWDDLKSEQQVAESLAAQVEHTARILGLPRQHVLPVSAQKALVGRIRGDAAMVERSGVRALEELVSAMVPERQRIIAERVARDFGVLVEISHQTVSARLRSARTEHAELTRLIGENRAMLRAMAVRLERDRGAYQLTLQNFRTTQSVVMKQGRILLSNLEPQVIEQIAQEHRRRIEGQLFTIPLMRTMQALFEHFSRETQKLLTFANQIKGLVDTVYVKFHEEYGFAQLSPPALSLDRYSHGMLLLSQRTAAFCRDPINVAHPKGMMINKFYRSLVSEACQLFGAVATETDAWLRRSLSPLTIQLREHEELLEQRVRSIQSAADDASSLESRIRELDRVQQALARHAAQLDEVRAVLVAPDDEVTTPQLRVA